MFKKLYNKLFNKKKKKKPNKVDAMKKLSEALRPSDRLKIVYEEINEYRIKGHLYKLGDKVISRSNECDPLLIGTLVEFWDNNGKWDNCIPQIKDNKGKVWGSMGILKPYSDELIEVLKPMRPLEQWNYLLEDNLKKYYSFTEEEMDRKEKQYENVQKIKNRNREKV